MAAESRDDFPKVVADALAKRAAFICSNPDCRVHTIAPSDESESKFLYIGKAAHICAAAKGGPRYDAAMSPEERKAASNGIFLCSSCADMIDKNGGLDFPVQRLRRWKEDHDRWAAANLNKHGAGRGGEGGDADATDGGTAIGGVGGDAGSYGDGGRGGNAIATDQISLAIGGAGGRGGVGPGGNGMDTTRSIGDIVVGGDGGDAPRPDGRGGRGGKSGARLFGVDQLHRLPDGRYPGEGGRGANSPSCEGKATTIKTLLREYYDETPLEVSHADKHSAVPLDWLNARLVQLGTTWRVQIDDGEFETIDATLAISEQYYKSLASRIGAAKVKPVERNPKGIALVICCRVEWDRFVQNSSFPRNFTRTFDSREFQEFPIDCSPFAAYFLISGSGIIEVLLSLLAPNEETLWERKILAEHWGEIGTCECSLTVSGLRIPRPGIYHWRLSHGKTVLLERPIVFRHRVEKPVVASQRDDSSEFPSSITEPEAAADGGRDSGSS